MHHLNNNYYAIEVLDGMIDFQIAERDNKPVIEYLLVFKDVAAQYFIELSDGTWEIVGMVGELEGSNNQMLLMGKDILSYKYTVSGYPLEVEIIAYDEIEEDWKQFCKENNLTPNTLILKKIEG